MTLSSMNGSQTARLREFRQSDAAAVRRLIHHTIDIRYSDVYPPRAVQFFKDFHSESSITERSHGGDVIVVEHSGEIVGTGALVEDDISGVFVHPTFQRQGLGKALICELERRASARGYREVVLSVSLPSRAFSQRLDYEIVENCSIDVGEGQHLDFWKARKTLMASPQHGARLYPRG